MNNKGLTIVEIIITVAILGIVALLFVSIFGTSFVHIMNAGRDSQSLIEDQKQVESLISTLGPGVQYDIDMHDLFPTVYSSSGSEMLEGVLVDEGDFITYLAGVKNYVIFVTNIILSTNSVTIDEIGYIENIHATLLPSDATDQDVIWTSSDTSVVIVQNGLLTGRGVGTATVTATAEGSDPFGTPVTSVVNVTVNTGGPALGTDSSLSALYYDGTFIAVFNSTVYHYEIEVAGNTAPTVTYTLSDSNASVSVVQAVDSRGGAYGSDTATVTVTSEDGNYVSVYTVTFNKKNYVK